MNKFYGYGRVSSEDQQQGYGPEIQRAMCERYRLYAMFRPDLKDSGVQEGEIFFEDDGVSAYKTKFFDRPKGHALDLLLTRGDHVVVAKLDRAFRNAKDALHVIDCWEQRGITVHFADFGASSNTANGKLVIRMMAVFANWWSDMHSERMREMHARKKANGELGGGHAKAKPGFRRRKVLNARGRRVAIWIPTGDDDAIIERIRYLRDQCRIRSLKRACIGAPTEYEIVPVNQDHESNGWKPVSWKIIGAEVGWSGERCMRAYRLS